MKIHKRIEYEPVGDDLHIPMPQVEVLDCKCTRCHNVYSIPVPVDYLDWEDVAKKYKEGYDLMNAEYRKLFSEAGEVFDIPLKEWLDAKNAHLRMILENLI